MKAIILAAGPSTRLRPMTEYLPKTLLEIEDKKVIVRIMESHSNILSNRLGRTGWSCLHPLDCSVLIL